MEEIEQWKDVQGYEGFYSVSNLGRVKSLVRKGRKTERILTPTDNGYGYLIVGLRRDSKVKSFLVHRLVMSAFEPTEQLVDLEVNHKDFDTTNNKLTNLEWCTSQENADHFRGSGRKPDSTKTTGENHHLTKLTRADVERFREMFATGKYSTHGLARLEGVPESTMRLILKNKTWK
jgi:hypothetical protein